MINPVLPPLVCALAYDGLCAFEYGICVEIFGLERAEIAGPLYRFETVGIEPGPLSAVGGLSVTPSAGLERLKDADLILIPGWCSMDAPVPGDLTKALQAAHKRGARIISICSGVFVLAATGLLDGKRATTHWRYSDALAARFPEIIVEPDVLYIDEGGVLTSAGSAAGIDLCLHIIRGDHGADTANALARSLVLPAHREGGQVQYIPRPVSQRSESSIAPLLDSLRSEISASWTTRTIAEAAQMSSRTLLRRFKAHTGMSPMVWLMQQRVVFARELLETTQLGIASIGEVTGLGAPETVRLHFKRQVGVSPSVYRKQYHPALSAYHPSA